MKSSVVQHLSTNETRSYPCLLEHTGGGALVGDVVWKNTVLLFFSETNGTIVFCGEKLKKQGFYGLGAMLTSVNASAYYWKPFEGQVILEN